MEKSADCEELIQVLLTRILTRVVIETRCQAPAILYSLQELHREKEKNSRRQFTVIGSRPDPIRGI